MTNISKRICKCEQCGVEFLRKEYLSINSTLNKELKNLLLEDKIYEYECPVCHHKGYSVYPLLYHDMDKKIMIHANTFEGGIVELYEDMMVENRLDFFKQGGFVTHIIAPSPYDLYEKIFCIEHDLDYRIIAVCDRIIVDQLNKCNEEENANIEIKHCYLYQEDDNHKPIYLTSFDNYNNNTQGSYLVEFDEQMYNDVKNDFSKIFDEVRTPYISQENAYSIFGLLNLDSKKYESYINEQNEVLVLFNEQNQEYYFALLDESEKGKYEVGEKVVCRNEFDKGKKACGNYKFIKAIVNAKFKMNYAEFLVSFGSLSKDKFYEPLFEADYEYCLEDTPYDDDLNSNNIINEISKYLHDDGDKTNKYDLSGILDTKVAVCYKKPMEDEVSELNVVSTHIKGKNRGEYMCVYLNKDEIQKNKEGEKGYSFISLRNAIKAVLVGIDKFKGAIINPYSDKILLTANSILQILIDSITLSYEKTIELYNKLCDMEKEKICKEGIQIMKYSYIDKISIDDIRKKMGIENQDANYYLAMAKYDIRFIVEHKYLMES